MRPQLRNRLVLAALAAAGILGSVRGPLWACLWDSDTLESEAKGVADVVRAVTGRFERNPPLYYEMRLERAYGRVKSNPDDFEAYDDAGVACDRLGRGDEAVEWMGRKRERLDAAEAKGRDVKDQRYRYLANLGTFWAHRWFRNGADRARIAEMETARDFIAKAVALNPDAHFGREPYQLKILDWVIRPPAYDTKPYQTLPTFVDFAPNRDNGHAAVTALTGLITMGNAWESVDVFNALVLALEADGGRTSVAYLARYRAEELVRAGKGSVVPGAPKGEDLVARLAHPFQSPTREKAVAGLYQKLRVEADAWHKARTDFMNRRLEQGLHPDTDAKFWDGYVPKDSPSLELPADEKVMWHTPVDPKPGLAEVVRGPSGVALGAAAASATLAVLLRRARYRRLGKKPPGQFLAD